MLPGWKILCFFTIKSTKIFIQFDKSKFIHIKLFIIFCNWKITYFSKILIFLQKGWSNVAVFYWKGSYRVQRFSLKHPEAVLNPQT